MSVTQAGYIDDRRTSPEHTATRALIATVGVGEDVADVTLILGLLRRGLPDLVRNLTTCGNTGGIDEIDKLGRRLQTGLPLDVRVWPENEVPDYIITANTPGTAA